MKLFAKMYLMCLAVLTIPVMSIGCDLCGSYFGVLPMENQNTFNIVHRFRVYNGYPVMSQNGTMFPSGSYRLAQPPSVQHGSSQAGDVMEPDDFESYKLIEMRGRYFVHERVQMEFVLPLVNNKAKSLGGAANVWGIGDISLCIGYRVMQSPAEKEFRQRMILGLGVKLPTGSVNSTFDDGDRLPLRMQPGTGSYDGIAMLTYAASWNSWAIGLTTNNRFCASNDYYEQMAPVTNNTLVITKVAVKKSCEFYPQLQVYQEFTPGMRENGFLIAGTKMNNLLCGPGLDVYYKKFGFGASAQFPLYQEVYEMNMEMTWRLTLGVSYNFKSEKYLLQ